MVFLWLSLVALAQDAVKLEVVQTAQVGGAPPTLIVLPQVDATALDVDVQCSNERVKRTGTAKAGERIVLTFPLKEGTHNCTGTLSGQFEDGSAGEMPLSFQIRVLASLFIEVTKDDLALDEHALHARVTQPISRLDVLVYGPGGLEIGKGAMPIGASAGLGPHRLEWSPKTETEIVQIRVTAKGISGVETELDLFPWSFTIPHEDVVFDTNQHTIQTGQTPKLTDALSRIRAVLDKYGQGVGGFEVPIRLYVAGYTDTVGDPSKNQSLSERRALSIAKWFRDHGFTRPVFTQGFGERGLLVQTADGIDNPNNRRTAYILCADPPARSELLPGTRWEELR
jgi:outer membrane protein OmpA-like peptidoglycan-associated protein